MAFNPRLSIDKSNSIARVGSDIFNMDINEVRAQAQQNNF
jgi:hypothetical protein